MKPDFRPVARLFKALAEANRLKIIHVLKSHEMSVSQIVEATGLSQPLISHHLRALREAGIVRTRRDGAFVLHALADPAMLDRLEAWGDVVGASSDRLIAEQSELELPHWIPASSAHPVHHRRRRRRRHRDR